jgi:hypothetical protein
MACFGGEGGRGAAGLQRGSIALHCAKQARSEAAGSQSQQLSATRSLEAHTAALPEPCESETATQASAMTEAMTAAGFIVIPF